jgi:hypothetical protein
LAEKERLDKIEEECELERIAAEKLKAKILAKKEKALLKE